eukprot:TRINITY_DN55049_c0_g1_i1.p1 TRINITY_DN55049_c0_g1~~TRINITY_DN55049_c0_g1_i1.p1  ORF type:complete len:442 (+),score=54.08 TRINITY_DN55049_c0_g1_i1:81-1406(+)
MVRSSAHLARDEDEEEFQLYRDEVLDGVYVCECWFGGKGCVYVSPLALLIAIFIAFYGEANAVCKMQPQIVAREIKHVEGCGPDDVAANDGELVHITCDLTPEGLPTLSIGDAGFADIRAVASGLSAHVDMLQCIEFHERFQSRADGGSKKLTDKYMYEVEWNPDPVDSSKFEHRAGDRIPGVGHHPCDVDNPEWPKGVFHSQDKYADVAFLGSFRLSSDLVSRIPLTKSLKIDPPPDWRRSEDGKHLISTKQASGVRQIGSMRIEVFSNDWDAPTMSVVGLNQGGMLAGTRIDGVWGCPEVEIGDIELGDVNAVDMVDAYKFNIHVHTWVLRAVSFLIFWFGFFALLSWFEVEGGMFPVIEAYLGHGWRAVAVVGLYSCVPALGCLALIVGIINVKLRPVAGTIWFLVCIITTIGTILLARKKKMVPEQCPTQYGAAESL